MNLQPLGSTGFFIDPASGRIFDPSSGRIYNNAEEIAASFSQYEAPKQSGQSGNVAGAGGALGSIGSGVALSNLFSGGAAATPAVASTAAPVATTALGGTGAFGTGGAMMSAGTYGGNMAALGGGGAGLGASLLPAAGIAAGALTGGLQGKGLYDVAKGDRMNIGSQAALALPTFGASFLYNPVKKMFGSKREGERNARKETRRSLQDLGFMNQDSRSRYNLADGSQFDIRDFKKNTGRDAYNIEFRDGDVDQNLKVGAVNALAAAMTGNNSKLRADMAGELYNAYSSGGDFWQNLRAAADKAGGVDAWANSLQQNKGLKDDERAAFMSGLDSIYNERSRETIRQSLGQNQNKPLAPVQGKPAPQQGVNRSGGRQGIRRV